MNPTWTRKTSARRSRSTLSSVLYEQKPEQAHMDAYNQAMAGPFKGFLQAFNMPQGSNKSASPYTALPSSLHDYETERDLTQGTQPQSKWGKEWNSINQDDLK